MSDKTSLELFNEAREAGATIGDSIRLMQHDEAQLDALPPAPPPIFLVLSLDGHKLGVTKRGVEFVASCSCGSTWSHKASETTRTMEAVFTSHVAYYTKRKTEAL